jgi:hypothetical protein
VRLGKSPHHQPAHRHPWKKVAQGQACATPQNNTITPSSGNKLYTLYQTKVFRPTLPIL